MKVLAILLLCALAAVQGRSAAGERNSKSLVALGDNPYLVHLRIAVATSGFLNSAVGSLISDRWVLSSADVVQDARFIWVRYGAVTVINPSLVTETSTVRTSDRLALISINRAVESTANIAPVALARAADSESTSTNFSGFGQTDDGQAGEYLYSFIVSLVAAEDSITISSEDGTTTNFDLGAPLVVGDKQIGVLVQAGGDDNDGVVEPLDKYLEWIEEETGVSAGSQPEDVIVHFVN